LKSEIATIVYQNGMIDVFGEKEKEKEEVKPIFEDDNLFVPRIGGIGQSKMENEFYAIGTDDNKMLNYLRKYDASSHEKFVAACNQRSKGKSLFGQGMALTGLGAIVFIGFVNMEEDPTAHTNRKLILLATGTVIMAVGEVFIIVSIPISASAGAKKKAIKEDFEQQYFSNKKYSYQPKLNFGITQGGLGFTLNF
jgi:hypothetical protein